MRWSTIAISASFALAPAPSEFQSEGDAVYALLCLAYRSFRCPGETFPCCSADVRWLSPFGLLFMLGCAAARWSCSSRIIILSGLFIYSSPSSGPLSQRDWEVVLWPRYLDIYCRLCSGRHPRVTGRTTARQFVHRIIVKHLLSSGFLALASVCSSGRPLARQFVSTRPPRRDALIGSSNTSRCNFPP